LKKDREKENIIREKLCRNMEDQKTSIFDEESDDDTVPQTADVEELNFLRRRNYEKEKREFDKFNRAFTLPPFKFYIKTQRIRELMFEIKMEYKRDENDRS